MKLTRCSVINSIAYRADTRRPEEIFANGFSNRQTPEYQWLQILSGNPPVGLDPELDGDISLDHLSLKQQQKLNDTNIPKECEPIAPGKLTYRVWVKGDPAAYFTVTLVSVEGITNELWTRYINNRPFYRTANEDISPKTAVCFTLRPHVAPYFPIEGCLAAAGEWVWIYVVILGAAYKTFVLQQKRGVAIASAKEVAIEHMSGTHVLCAVRCWRKGVYPTVNFVVSPRIIWNPIAGGERMLCKNDILKALNPFQGMETITTACEIAGSVRNSGRLFLEPKYPYWIWNK